jgi:hypothetical protein
MKVWTIAESMLKGGYAAAGFAILAGVMLGRAAVSPS